MYEEAVVLSDWPLFHFSIPVITKNGAVLANHQTASEVEIAGFSSEELAKLRDILMKCGLDGIVTEHENGIEKKTLRYDTDGLRAYVKEHEDDPRMCFVKDEQEFFSVELTYFVYIASKEELEPIYQSFSWLQAPMQWEMLLMRLRLLLRV